MQRVAMPPSPELVQKAREWSKNKPGSTLRILTMKNMTQRVVVLFRAKSFERECPHYYDPELDRASPMGEYPNLGKGLIDSSVLYKESEYERSLDAFKNYQVLLGGGMVVSSDPGKTV